MNSLILRDFNFFKLWFSQVISQGGNRMFQIAILWWLTNHFGSTYLGLFLVFGILPSILLVKIIGKTLSQHMPTKILLLSDFGGVIFSIILIVLSYLGNLYLPFILLSSFIYSLFQSFINPTLNKSVTDLVSESDIEEAVAFISSTETLANFAGAIIGAFLIEKLGITGIIFLNGLTYLVSFFCDATLKFKKTPILIKEVSKNQKSKFVIPFTIKKILLSFALVNFFSMPVLILLPLYTQKILKGSADTLGFLESALWIGLLSGTFLSQKFPLKSKTMQLVGISLFLFGISLILPSIFVNQSLFLIALFTMGFSLGVMNTRLMTYFQKNIKDEDKGPFFAHLSMLISFTVPVSYFFFGLVADYLLPTTMAFIQGFSIILISFYYFYLHKEEIKYLYLERTSP